MEKVASELFRILKPNKFCAILIGDTRRQKMYQPLCFMVMQRFLKVGFAPQRGYYQTSTQLQSDWFLDKQK